MAMTKRVKRILFRRSATRNMFRRRDSTGSGPPRGKARGRPRVYRFVRAFPRAGGRFTPPGGSTTSTVPPAALIFSAAEADTAWTRTVRDLVISPRPSTLTRPCLWTRPRARSVSGVTSVPASKAVEVVEVDDRVLNPEGVLEALELRGAPGERGLATLELGRDLPLPPGALPLRPGTGCLPAPAGGAAGHPLLLRFEPGAGFRSWTFIALLLLDGDEVRHPGQHPPDLRAVGQDVGRVDAAQPEGPDGAPGLRLRADGRLDSVTFSSPAITGPRRRASGAGCARCRPAACRPG